MDIGHAAAEHHPSGHDDKEQQDNLENGEKVHAVHADFGKKGMDDRDKDDDANGNASFLPFARDTTGRNDNVRRKDDASRC